MESLVLGSNYVGRPIDLHDVRTMDLKRDDERQRTSLERLEHP